MGYCNELNIKFLMAQTLTTGTSDTPASGSPGYLIDIGRQFKKNMITDETINQYIVWAGSQIDADLSSMYNTPFARIADFESFLYSDISEYNDHIILASTAPALSVGDEIVLIEGDVEEEYTISEIVGNGVYNVSTYLASFTTAARLLRVKYPDPINLIATRLAAANIYEKYFAAMTNPQSSEYGKLQKKLAKIELNNILHGITVLRGAHRISNIFKNGNIRSRYSLPTGEIDNNGTIEDA